MLAKIFAELPERYRPERVKAPLTYYFTLGEFKRTVFFSPESCRVEEGKATAAADCVCKTDPDFFLKIWNEGYRPGLKDFMSGTIKSNKPDELKTFLAAFGKD